VLLWFCHCCSFGSQTQPKVTGFCGDIINDCRRRRLREGSCSLSRAARGGWAAHPWLPAPALPQARFAPAGVCWGGGPRAGGVRVWHPLRTGNQPSSAGTQRAGAPRARARDSGARRRRWRCTERAAGVSCLGSQQPDPGKSVLGSAAE